MSGMTPERLAEIRERAEVKRWDYLDETEADRADLLAEVDRLRAGIEALYAHAHRTHDHGWGQLLDVVLRPGGEDLADYVAMHEADSTGGETNDR